MKRALFLLLFLSGWAAGAHAADGVVQGRVTDQSGLPLPGVTVSLSAGSAQPVVATTDANGAYQFTVPAGRYTLKAELSGFNPFSVAVDVGANPVTQDVTLAMAALTEEVTVTGAAPSVIGSLDTSKPATVSHTVIDNAPMPTSRYTDVLPLLPNVVRGPDGLISVAGARAPQGSLLVNGVRETDPYNGEFAATLPLEAVESVQVYANSPSAEFGRASAGITEVTTRSGDDKLRFSFNSWDPRVHTNHGRITGVDAWEPKASLSGPISKGRAWFAQSVDYRYNKNYFDTVVGRQTTELNELTSLSQVDVMLRPGHLLTGWVSLYPHTLNHANLSAFNPASTTPNEHTGGWTATAIDRLSIGSAATLESRAQVKRLDFALTPDNSLPYTVGHEVTSGGYFNRQDRTAYRGEWSEVYSRTRKGRFGDHLFKAGGSLGYVTFSGINDSHPVLFLRSDGTTSTRVDFLGSPAFGASAREVGLFVQDTWSLTPSFKLDLGTRYDRTSLGGTRAALSPRAGWTYTLDSRTTMAGSAGIYADKVVIGAGGFDMLQSRLVTEYDPSGTDVVSQVLYRNQTDPTLRMPYAARWNVQLDRQLSRDWLLRLNYQERHSYDELLVTPLLVSDSTGLLYLSSNGSSRARSLETTFGYHEPKTNSQVYISYVRAATHGNLNDLNSIEGNFKDPLVQADQMGPLPMDVPHRLLLWSVLNLPKRTTLAPFFEVRSGFPFSAIDENWNYVGARNTARFPVFASLDIVVSKVFKIPFGLPNARIGIRLYNVTGRENARDIQADIFRSDFGTTYNPIHRTLRGIFEFEWGK